MIQGVHTNDMCLSSLMELALILPIFSLENVVCLFHLLGIFNHTSANVCDGNKHYEFKGFGLSVDGDQIC